MILNRMQDKLELCLKTEAPVFSDFLDLAQLITVRGRLKSIGNVHIIEFLGFKDDERRMIGFIPDSYFDIMTEEDILALFPVALLVVEPSYDDLKMFGHRDLLGSVLGLGLERKLFGDIIINDRKAYVLCHERAATILSMELIQAGNVQVSASVIPMDNETHKLAPLSQEHRLSVASLRVDGIVKAVANCSRNEANALINSGNVKVNQVEVSKNHHLLQENDLISIRRHGKFKLKQIGNITKKGRISIVVLKYI